MHQPKKSIQALKEEIIKGDFVSLEKLYRIYFDRLRLYGVQFLPQENEHTIEDTIQELFIWIAKNTHRLAQINDLEVYLFSAFKKNRLYEQHRQKSKLLLKNKYLHQTETINNKVEGSTETNYIAKETQKLTHQQVTHLMNQLSTAQREVIYLRHFADLNYKSIAQIMELNEQVVRNYAYRALQKLRNMDNNKKDVVNYKKG